MLSDAAARWLAVTAVGLIATACSPPSQEQAGAAEGQTRTFYIAADPVDWDYAPAGNTLGPHYDADAPTFLETGPQRIGRIDRKSVYRAYTDRTFTTLAPRASEWEHLGMLGPMIHAEVGDTVKVVFKNNTPHPASVHPHGVLYDKASEGADYEDQTAGEQKTDDAVPEGGEHTYTWEIPSGPGPDPTTAARSCGRTTPTPTRSPTPTPA